MATAIVAWGGVSCKVFKEAAGRIQVGSCSRAVSGRYGGVVSTALDWIRHCVERDNGGSAAQYRCRGAARARTEVFVDRRGLGTRTAA